MNLTNLTDLTDFVNFVKTVKSVERPAAWLCASISLTAQTNQPRLKHVAGPTEPERVR